MPALAVAAEALLPALGRAAVGQMAHSALSAAQQKMQRQD